MRRKFPYIKFTDTWLRDIVVSETRRDEILESGGSGFGVRVSPSSKVFFLKRRVYGAQARFSLGKYPETTLDQAHVKAAKINEVIENGGDPRESRRLSKQIDNRKAHVVARAVFDLGLIKPGDL